MAASPTRVVLCEDSHTYSSALTRTLEHDGSVSVVGVFPTAERAIAALPRLQPDLVTMDLELPGMSGLDAVERIMANSPTPIVVLSDYSGGGSATASAALAAGALAAIPKAELDLRDPSGDGAALFRRRLTRLGSTHVVRHPLGRLNRPAAPRPEGRRAVAAIGVCASTGGPKALAAMLAAVPGSFPVPILVVQHIVPGFEARLATTIGRATDLPVDIAEDGMKLQRGVWLAPAGAHLRLGPNRRLQLAPRRPGESYCPSGDMLLTSLAQMLGHEGVGVVLTGMGEDGARGIGDLRAAGGLTVAQDAASSIVFGMPRAAAREGADVVLEPREIGRLLTRLRPSQRRPDLVRAAPPAEGRAHLRLIR